MAHDVGMQARRLHLAQEGQLARCPLDEAVPQSDVRHVISKNGLTQLGVLLSFAVADETHVRPIATRVARA